MFLKIMFLKLIIKIFSQKFTDLEHEKHMFQWLSKGFRQSTTLFLNPENAFRRRKNKESACGPAGIKAKTALGNRNEALSSM